MTTVAVCIATILSRQRLLEEALASVLAQSRLPDEIIVELDRHGHGAAATRNRAWRRANSDTVAFLDDDDVLLADHVQRCLDAIDAGADLVYPWFERVGWEGPEPLAVPVNGHLVHPLGVPFGPELAAHLRQHNWISTTVMVRRQWLERIGGYPDQGTVDRRYRGADDWALVSRLHEAGARIAHVPAVTWQLRHHDSQTAGRPGR